MKPWASLDLLFLLYVFVLCFCLFLWFYVFVLACVCVHVQMSFFVAGAFGNPLCSVFSFDLPFIFSHWLPFSGLLLGFLFLSFFFSSFLPNLFTFGKHTEQFFPTSSLFFSFFFSYCFQLVLFFYHCTTSRADFHHCRLARNVHFASFSLLTFLCPSIHPLARCYGGPQRRPLHTGRRTHDTLRYHPMPIAGRVNPRLASATQGS